MSIEERQYDLGDGVACPTCGKAMEMATGFTGGRSPRSGDVTVCFYCASVLEVAVSDQTDSGLSLVVPSADRKKRLMDQSPPLRLIVTSILRKRGMA